MRLSELAGKKIINLYDGAMMGTVGDSDLLVDPQSGAIDSLMLPRRNDGRSARNMPRRIAVPWEAVKKIGAEVIVVDIDPGAPDQP
jgi:YlmC/YmxH family sporulation protein